MKPTITIVNVSEDTETTREMTKEELAIYEAESKAYAEELALKLQIQSEKEAARQSAVDKLAALGLTEAEIQALTA